MHDTALKIGQLFMENYVEPCSRVLDVGALDINGSLRQFAPSTMTYIGVDMVAGKGVDTVLDDPHRLPFDDASFDAVVSTSCYEHDPAFWLSFNEAIRVLRPSGFLYMNAPSNGHVHRHPTDCSRFYPTQAWHSWPGRAERVLKLS